jgi:hypothetical protein
VTAVSEQTIAIGLKRTKLTSQGDNLMMDSYHSSIAVEFKFVRVTSAKTTLYELIDAISDVVEAGEERLIPKVVLHLIDSGKIRISGSLEYL